MADDLGGYTGESIGDERASMEALLKEYDVIRAQREKRIKLLESLEAQETGKKIRYLGFFCHEAANASIDADDIPAIGNALASIGDVDQLNLVINSPGGDGTIAEKIIELCRAYSDEFRVVVPNRAKSAATIIALGADQIVMGYCSELGPIDAQVVVMSAGIPQFISAQSFIDARDSLEERYKEASAAGEDTQPILQQLASLDPPYINHCEKLMAFSRDVAELNLRKNMLKNVRPAAKRDRQIKKVLDRLSSTSITKVHGRMIDANTAKTDLGLKVHLLAKDDESWKLLWEYYLRADIYMGAAPTSAKLVETRNEMLVKPARLR